MLSCRDLKPENMLLASVPPGEAAGPTGWRLKVIDYGCSGFCLPGRKLHDAVGTVRGGEGGVGGGCPMCRKLL